ncbi:MAG: hypothetical protein WAX48_13645 [Desulfosalsimonadaceae bacterium]
MTKKSKTPIDLNKLAAFIADQATSEATPQEEEKPQKNQAAVELGRLGGLKGGKARANKLTPEQRKEIARKAAKARWNKKQS